MSQKCPMCGSVVLYQGLATLECEGPTTCPNAAPPDRRPTQRQMKAVTADAEFEEGLDFSDIGGWMPGVVVGATLRGLKKWNSGRVCVVDEVTPMGVYTENDAGPRGWIGASFLTGNDYEVVS